MFVVEIGAVITTVAWLIQVFGGAPLGGGHEPAWFTFTVAVWLWLTVVFANLAEALAEGRGRPRRRACARCAPRPSRTLRDGGEKPASELRRGDVVVVEAGEVDPRRRHRDRGHRLGRRVGDHRRVGAGDPRGRRRPLAPSPAAPGCSPTGSSSRSPRSPGRAFLDRMIALVEGAERRKTPNEIALGILLAGADAGLPRRRRRAAPVRRVRRHRRSRSTTLIALLVALIPTTIGALLSAIGIAGMDRLVRRNVLALSGRAVEASGDVDVLLLDKTGTITLGNREAAEFIPMPGVGERGAGRGGADVLARRRDARGPLDRRPRQAATGIREHDLAGHERALRPLHRARRG